MPEANGYVTRAQLAVSVVTVAGMLAGGGYGWLSNVTDRINSLQAEQARVKAAMIEIETQFCAEDNTRNLTHANDLRLLAMLWKKGFGDDLPIGNAFYARIGRCQSGKE